MRIQTIYAVPLPRMKNPCDGAIACYAKDDADTYVSKLIAQHAAHEKYLTDVFDIREKALQAEITRLLEVLEEDGNYR